MKESSNQAWLCILNEENFEIVKKKRVYGIPNKPSALNHFSKFKVGDVLVFYVISPRKMIMGIAKTSCAVFEENKKSPWKYRLYPHRVRISKVLETAIPSRAFIGRVSAIKKRIPMGTSIMPLVERDLTTIQELVRAQVVSAS